MKKVYFSALLFTASLTSMAQDFEKKINLSSDYLAPEVLMPASPLKMQPLFIGGVDKVETSAGQAIAKENHDFIGLTADSAKPGEFWVSVNHEMQIADAKIGDGGGMTVFKIKQNADGSVTVLPQSIPDGRSGQFFNVDFKATTGETMGNCGGICTKDGRIWTAEESFRSNNKSLSFTADTSDFTIGTTTPAGFPGFNGQTIKRYQNFNYMVEVDPKQAKAVRKQYNWGRQPFESGVVLKDNKTVLLTSDDVPGFLTKFVATTAGDFTAGKFYVYKQNAAEKWVEIDATDLNKMINFKDAAMAAGGTMFCRLEWVAVSPVDGNIFITETGRDDIGKGWPVNGNVAQHHESRAVAMGLNNAKNAAYTDYYGRVLKLDAETGEISVFLEGGPAYDKAAGVAPKYYPSRHLSNPDAMNFFTIGGKTYMMISEDLNGTSFNRMPFAMNTTRCELFFLDMSIQNPTVNDLIRITSSANGAEVTGVTALPDGKTLLFNSQHPELSTDINDYPYNHSLTVAVYGFEDAILGSKEAANARVSSNSFSIFPNPATREVHLSKVTDVAVYDISGNRVRVFRNTDIIDVAGLVPGKYIIKTKEGDVTSLIIQ